jgi:superfamily II DNA helicase RecQ
MQCKHFFLRVTKGQLGEDEAALNDFLQTVEVHSVHTAHVTTNTPYWTVLVFYEQLSEEGTLLSEVPAAAPKEEALTPEQEAIYERLRAWRLAEATRDGVPPYIIAHNDALRHIARAAEQLSTSDDLLDIPRLGAKKIEKYGAAILAVLRGDDEGEDLFDDEEA